jgi:hypothetical protein
MDRRRIDKFAGRELCTTQVATGFELTEHSPRMAARSSGTVPSKEMDVPVQTAWRARPDGFLLPFPA